jgi:hypothetical protein
MNAAQVRAVAAREREHLAALEIAARTPAPGPHPDTVLADRLATALRRLLRAHGDDLNTVGGVECVVTPGSALEQACDAVLDWCDTRGVHDDPDLAPWLRW